MKGYRFTFLLFLITLVILATLGIQLYWNYRNYEIGKEELTSDIQSSLDEAINTYYINQGKVNKDRIFSENGWQVVSSETPTLINLSDNKKYITKHLKNSASNRLVTKRGKVKEINLSSSELTIIQNGVEENINLSKDVEKDKKQILATTIILSMAADTLDLEALVPLIDSQFLKKEIAIAYGLRFTNGDKEQVYNTDIMHANVLKTVSTSAYLPNKSQFEIYFANATPIILKRNLFGIVLSFILIGSVIALLFWLLEIIKRQKKLAELKNDLISNMTHEFKTPISTVSVALEGLQNFNQENDPEKTKDYLEIAAHQLKKPNTMVERILNTVSLSGEELELRKESTDLIKLLKTIIQKFQKVTSNNTFLFESDLESVNLKIDKFLFENAINNLIDNAIKYGGNEIKLKLKKSNKQLKIIVEDSGKDLTSDQVEYIFDRFYRVSKGNRHDVKGFGIGLYYTEKIIKKHGGHISLDVSQNTIFIIELPYE